MPKPYPKEFRQDVVRVARNREPGQTLKQIAADFGISESCLAGWITQPVPIPASRPTTSRNIVDPKAELATECQAATGTRLSSTYRDRTS